MMVSHHYSLYLLHFKIDDSFYPLWLCALVRTFGGQEIRQFLFFFHFPGYHEGQSPTRNFDVYIREKEF